MSLVLHRLSLNSRKKITHINAFEEANTVNEFSAALTCRRGGARQKQQQGMARANASWSEENFSCCICLDVFNSPVSTPCGHNFCRTCITKHWDEQVTFKCPLCNMVFNTRPDLRVNTLLSELAAQFRTSIRVKDQLCVKPGEVPCDVCTGTQLKAVKSCLVCLISLLPNPPWSHIRESAVLKKHRLVEPMDRLEDRMCKKH
ncbi:unnamed protein product [Arctogadus glacialis]